MKNLPSLILITLFSFTSLSAFAIDQLTLTNGQIVQGKVLNDVPNRYVDIELLNGNTKRFERSEVTSVDRDVPNRSKDREMYGNQSNGFASVLLGGYDNLASNYNNPNKVLFDYGVKLGMTTSQMDSGGRLGFALSFDRVSQSSGSLTAAYNDLNVQMLMMRIANGGLYLGPNVGLAITSLSDSSGNSITQTDFEAGFGIGYEAYLSDSFSIGPDVRYEHIFSTFPANVIKFALAGSLHF